MIVSWLRRCDPLIVLFSALGCGFWGAGLVQFLVNQKVPVAAERPAPGGESTQVHVLRIYERLNHLERMEKGQEQLNSINSEFARTVVKWLADVEKRRVEEGMAEKIEADRARREAMSIPMPMPPTKTAPDLLIPPAELPLK